MAAALPGGAAELDGDQDHEYRGGDRSGTRAGISLAARWGGGFYRLVPTALCGVAGAVYAAWALLVEIMR